MGRPCACEPQSRREKAHCTMDEAYDYLERQLDRPKVKSLQEADEPRSHRSGRGRGEDGFGPERGGRTERDRSRERDRPPPRDPPAERYGREQRDVYPGGSRGRERDSYDVRDSGVRGGHRGDNRDRDDQHARPHERRDDFGGGGGGGRGRGQPERKSEPAPPIDPIEKVIPVVKVTPGFNLCIICILYPLHILCMSFAWTIASHNLPWCWDLQELKEMERATRTVFVSNVNLRADERDVFGFFSQVRV